MPAWTELAPGTELTIVKRAPHGSEAARYSATVLTADAPAPWLVAEARWTMREVETASLRFVRGDVLHEFFSPDHWFNVFSVFAPGGALRGWYANVTYPATVDVAIRPPVLTWHDLYVDVILLPGGQPATLDEDELAASGLASANSELHARILATRDELLGLAQTRSFPFHEQGNAKP